MTTLPVDLVPEPDDSSPEPVPPSSAAVTAPNPAFAPVLPSLELLQSAWEKHDVFDRNATQTQQRFFFLRRLLAYLSVLVVVLAVAQPIMVNQTILRQSVLPNASSTNLQALHDRLNSLALWNLWSQNWILALTNFLLILFPIVTTGLRAFSVKFDRGNNWVLLRGSAEALKMEIYYYRTRTKPYDQNRNKVLAEKLQLISERIKGSSIHQTALAPYEGEGATRLELGLVLLLLSRPWIWINRLSERFWDLLFRFKEVPVAVPQPLPLSAAELAFEQRYCDLDVDRYLHYRLEDQFDWYRRKAKGYNRQHQIFQTLIFFFGGLGTLLAATGFQNWVAVTAAVAGTLLNYLEYRRVEVTLVGYNQAADTLYDIRAWWYSLSEAEKADPKNFEKLVISTEETIRSEHNSWLQDMQDRLAKLYESTGDRQKPDSSSADQSEDSTADSSPASPTDVASTPDPKTPDPALTQSTTP